MKLPKAVRDWQKCVSDAKKIQRQSVKTYVPTRGTTLALAQKLYCLMGY